MSRKWIIALSVTGGVLVLVLFIVMALSTSGVQTADGTPTVILGPITVLIASADPAAEDPDQYIGVRHEGPRFETTDLGTDLNLNDGIPDIAALETERTVIPDRIVRAVYLGDDHTGVPVYIYAQGSNHIGNLIGQFFLDGGTLFRFGSTYHCCLNGPLARAGMGEPVKTVSSTPDVGSTIVAEWHDLGAEVSVVALEIGGEPVGWQTPTSGSVLFRIDGSEIPVLIAYDANGKELARI